LDINEQAGDDKGEPTVKFHSLRNSLAALLALCGALLLASCGGGGPAGAVPTGGALAVLPQPGGTAYAGIPYTITIVGGAPPYTISSSDQGIFPVPASIRNNTFQVIPANPGVLDTGILPGQLPIRSVIVNVRENSGFTAFSTIQVAQNFLTGYGVTFTPTNCPGGGAVSFAACPGGRTAARFSAVFNGALFGGRQFRLQVISGNFSVTDPATGISSNSVLLTSDHDGVVTAFIDVPLNAKTSLAVLRVVDVATGVYADQVFVIGGTSPNVKPLTVIPDTITLTGTLTTKCGVGSTDVLVFDGSPPYTATSPDNAVLVTPVAMTTSPGRFTITVLKDAPPCVTGVPVVVADALGSRATVTVNSVVGTQVLPPLQVAPGTITLACGQSGAVSVVGGTGAFTVNSTSPTVAAVSAGNTVQILRLGNGLPGSVAQQTTTVTVTDGTTIGTVTVTSPLTCP
jgi:hypothetical protein